MLLNAYPCFAPMLRARLFALGWDGQAALVKTARPIEELLGCAKDGLPEYFLRVMDGGLGRAVQVEALQPVLKVPGTKN